MNITLIGMPGSGKSYIGAQLADALGLTFFDPDKIIEGLYKKPLQEVLDLLGEDAFLRTEADATVAVLQNHDDVVLSTGGSIVYSQAAMAEIQRLSSVVYLKVDQATLEERIGEIPRGIVGLNNRSFSDLFKERTALYQHWAAISVDGTQDADTIVTTIQNSLKQAT